MNSKPYYSINGSAETRSGSLAALIAILFVLNMVLPGAVFADAPEKATPCWELEQVSLITGRHRLTISPKAFKVESIGNRYVIISKAPDWRVYTFNPQSRRVYECELKSFKGNLAAGTGAFGGYLEQLPVLKAKAKSVQFLGQPSLKTHIENPAPASAIKRPSANKFNSVFFNTGDVLEADYWTWENSALPQSLQFCLNKMYRLPIGKFAFRLVTVNTDRENNFELDTTKLRKIPYDAKAFIVPANLQKVKEDLDVINDGRRNRAVKNLMDNWDDWGKIVDTNK